MPRIGLLSDSHGRASTTQQAVDLLLGEGVSRLIHLGDVGSMEVLEALVTPAPGTDEPVEAHVVFGNVDWDWPSLGRYAQSLGLHVDHPAGRVVVADRVIGFTHGDVQREMAALLADSVDYLCHGHSHEVVDRRSGGTRIVNPGALFRARSYTVAVLDPASDEVTFHPVGRC